MSEAEKQSVDADFSATQLKLLEDLQNHKTELEVHNENLRQTQIALEESNHRYVNLYELAPIAYLTLNKQGLINKINITGATLLGADRQKLLKRQFAGFVSQTYSDRWHQFFARQIQEGFPQSVELALNPINGIQRYVQLDCRPMLEKEGLVLRVTLTDITALKQAELVRYDSEAYHGILATTLDGFCIVSSEGRLLDVNQRYCELSGYSREELLRMSVNDLNAVGCLNDAKARIDKIIENGTDLFETTHRRKDGTVLSVEISVSYRDGECRVFYLFLRDITQRKQAETTLKASESLVTCILDSLTSHVAVLDAKGTIIAVNKAWKQFAEQNALPESDYKMLGSNYLDVCAKALEEDSSDEKLKQVLCGIKAVLTGTLTRFQTEYPCHSATEQRWFSMTVSALLGTGGGAVVAHHNITGLIQSQQQLRESEARLYLCQKYGRIGLFEVDLMTNRHIWSASVYEELGFPVFENPSMEDFLSVVYPDDRQVILDALDAHLYQGRKYDLEHRAILADGQLHWLRAIGRAQFASDGTPLRFMGAVYDITERKYAEQQLQESEQKLAAMFDIVDVGIAITDEQGNIVDCNKCSEIILGLSKEQHLQRNYADKNWQVIRPDFTIMPVEEFASVKALATNTTVSHVEMGIVKTDGKITWLLATATPLQLEGYGVVITYIDISAQKQAEVVLLRERQQLLDKVINSHEELEKAKNEAEKINTALEVILKYREADSSTPKNKLLSEMDSVILPLFKKLKRMSTDKSQKILIDLLDTQLQQLSKSYGAADNNDNDYQQLTPTEMQVALLIRQGLSSKVIGSILDISVDTVSTHRKHIRKKLKLDGNPSNNLRNHLLSLVKPDDTL